MVEPDAFAQPVQWGAQVQRSHAVQLYPRTVLDAELHVDHVQLRDDALRPGIHRQHPPIVIGNTVVEPDAFAQPVQWGAQVQRSHAVQLYPRTVLDAELHVDHVQLRDDALRPGIHRQHPPIVIGNTVVEPDAAAAAYETLMIAWPLTSTVIGQQLAWEHEDTDWDYVFSCLSWEDKQIPTIQTLFQSAADYASAQGDKKLVPKDETVHTVISSMNEMINDNIGLMNRQREALATDTRRIEEDRRLKAADAKRPKARLGGFSTHMGRQQETRTTGTHTTTPRTPPTTQKR